MPGPATTVFVKELADAMRDRRSLAAGLLYAVWGPLVMALALAAMARDRQPDEPLVLAVEGRGHAPSLMAFLADRSVEVVGAPVDAAAAVRARSLAVAVVVDPAYPDRFRSARPAGLRLLYDGSWPASHRRARRVRALLEEYGRLVAGDRLVLRGVTPAAAAPLAIEERDVSTAAGRAAAALAMLPIFLLIAAFIGGMNVAGDVTAGERERNALEPLLAHPVSRAAIALGKWGAAAVMSAATLALTVLVSSAILRHPRIAALDLPVGLSGTEAGTVLLLLLPLAALAPAVQVLVSLFARSVKEAQTHLSVLLLVPMVPGFLLALGSVRATGWMTWVPILGQHVLVTAVLRGELAVGSAAVGLALVTVAAAAVAIGLTARLLGREKILRGLQA